MFLSDITVYYSVGDTWEVYLDVICTTLAVPW